MTGFYATVGLLLILSAMAAILRLPRRRRGGVRTDRGFVEQFWRELRALVRPVKSEAQRQASDEAFRKMVDGRGGREKPFPRKCVVVGTMGFGKGAVKTLFKQLARPVDETPPRQGRVHARAKDVRTLFDRLRRHMPTLCAARAYQFAAMVVFGGFPAERLGIHAGAMRQLPEYSRAATFMAIITTEAKTRGIPVPQMTLGIRSLCECKPGTHPWQAMFEKVK